MESTIQTALKFGKSQPRWLIAWQIKEHKTHLKSANAKRYWSLSICPALEQRDKEEKVVGWLGIKQLEWISSLLDKLRQNSSSGQCHKNIAMVDFHIPIPKRYFAWLHMNHESSQWDLHCAPQKDATTRKESFTSLLKYTLLQDEKRREKAISAH